MSGDTISRASGPQSPKQARARGDVDDAHPAVVGQVGADPAQVVVAEGRAGHDQEAIVGQAA